jgi:hypothetical protein
VNQEFDCRDWRPAGFPDRRFGIAEYRGLRTARHTDVRSAAGSPFDFRPPSGRVFPASIRPELAA